MFFEEGAVHHFLGSIPFLYRLQVLQVLSVVSCEAIGLCVSTL